MKNPKGKRWWKSSAVWSGLGTIAVGIFSIVTGNVIGGIGAIATGAGAIFGRVTATQEITTKKNEDIPTE